MSWRAKLKAGETVAVLGAGGVVGGLAIQAARHLGAGQAVAVVRGAAQVERAQHLGATAVVDTALFESEESLAAAMRERAPAGFNVVIDYLWGMPVAAATQNAAVGARIVQVGGVTGDSAALSAMAIRARGIDLLGFAGYLAPREARGRLSPAGRTRRRPS